MIVLEKFSGGKDKFHLTKSGLHINKKDRFNFLKQPFLFNFKKQLIPEFANKLNTH